MRRRLPSLLPIIVSLGMLAACSGVHVGGGGGGASWCRLDDPAFAERERKRLKLERADAGRVACPKPTPASKRPEELVLPMPCGRRMVFRKVSVQMADTLAFETAAFGDPDAGNSYRKAVTGPWRGEVAGSFSGNVDGSGPSYYYIAKYELTEPQRAAFADPALKAGEDPGEGAGVCKAEREAASKVEGAQVLPAVRLSWADAMSFADRYSRWLIAYEGRHGGLGQVAPNNESRPGFVRLPTEAEWEFAARGGGEGQTGGRTYALHADWGGALSPDLGEIAWFRGVGQEPPRGAAVYYVGRKKPNRLMLFDMVGNAEELTYDLFRPVRPDGLVAGRPGGAVVRGGGAEDGPDLVGVGVRREVELYDQNGPVAGPTTGARLVIAAPFFANRRGDGGEMQGNPAFRNGLTGAWERLARGEGAPGAQARDEGLAALQQLRAAPPPPPDALKARLGAIEAQLRTASAAVAAADETNAEQEFLTAILTAGYGREKTRKIAEVRAQADRLRALAATNPRLSAAMAKFDRALAGDENERRSAADYYVQIVGELARRTPDQLTRVQAAVSDRLRRGNLDRLLRWAPVVRKHVGESRAGPPSTQSLQRWTAELDTTSIGPGMT